MYRLSSPFVFCRRCHAAHGTVTISRGTGRTIWYLGTTMASLWSSLEKDVFNPQKKRLLETIRVWKTGKKKKMSILCVVGEKRGGVGDRWSCKPSSQ